MQDRGLLIPDVERAERYVRSIGYYRLSPYMIPFRRAGSDDFRSGVAFDDVLDLYVFDRKLRLLVLDALERVEVAVRSALTDHMAQAHGAFWYGDSIHFRDARRHRGFVAAVRDDCSRQLLAKPEQTDGALVHRSALEHYLLTYGKPELPPSWIVMERLTLGQVEHLIGNLKRRSDRTAIAKSLGINEPLLLSWMRTFVRVRNICAHHGRLWNAVLGVSPALPTSLSVTWLADPTAIADSAARRARLYPVLVALQSLLSTLSPGSSWAWRLKALFDEHPDVPLTAMGMPPGWSDDPFWARRIEARSPGGPASR
ncbi:MULTISPECIES: Abi family protein [unclassified Luteococcus]|uniref:Abi family protein n=1 Tax=unclassified Luteococcus TaxID=2639923 RepID=UPI00313E8C9C